MIDKWTIVKKMIQIWNLPQKSNIKPQNSTHRISAIVGSGMQHCKAATLVVFVLVLLLLVLELLVL